VGQRVIQLHQDQVIQAVQVILLRQEAAQVQEVIPQEDQVPVVVLRAVHHQEVVEVQAAEAQVKAAVEIDKKLYKSELVL